MHAASLSEGARLRLARTGKPAVGVCRKQQDRRSHLVVRRRARHDNGGVSVDAEVQRLANTLSGRVEGLLDDLVARTRREAPEYFASEDGAVVEILRESGRANFGLFFASLADSRELPDVPPAGAVAEARALAEVGGSLAELVRSYHIGHAAGWDVIIAEAERMDLDAETRTAVLQLVGGFAFAYIDRICALVSAEYGRAREGRIRSLKQRRTRLVHDLLAGCAVDDLELGYPLRLTHTAAIAWGERPDDALSELATAFDATHLTIPGPLDAVWGWIAHDESRPCPVLEPPPMTHLALGRPGRGPAGFVRSHQQARAARAVALRTGEPVTHWRMVALQALVLHDEDAARAFAREELGPLAADGDRAAVLRDTLLAWFDAHQKTAAAAALLRVHERTVSYRLRTIEQQLGYPISARGAELATALRLYAHCRLT